ncbi:hypothetical protein [Prevotella sp. HUN102]|uniref:hypothetical protein n=1 Tax=Prevotella sp. HUN102 TaxID=1392486 RepID=UPI00048E850B|nr:hypothetical protein [Prevotella sp. HUN102]
MLLVSATWARGQVNSGQDQLIFHETFDKNYNIDFTGTSAGSGFGGLFGAWTWDSDDYWVNNRDHSSGGWGFYKMGPGLNSVVMRENGGYITTKQLGEIDKKVNGRTFPDKDDITVKIKIGKPFGLVNLQAGIISAIFKIFPRITNINLKGAGPDTKCSADHLSMGGWRTTFFGSTTKTFEIRNATPTTQVQFVGNIQTCIYDIRFYREGRPTDKIWNIDDIDGSIIGEASGWMYGYVTRVETQKHKVKVMEGGKEVEKDENIYTLIIRKDFNDFSKEVAVPLYNKTFEIKKKAITLEEAKELPFSAEQYVGINKLKNIHSAGDLINSKVLFHATFNKDTGQKLYRWLDDKKKNWEYIDNWKEPVADVDRMLVMTPLYSELTDYRMKDSDIKYMNSVFSFDGKGVINGKEYDGVSKNHLFYVLNTSDDAVREIDNVISVHYDAINAGNDDTSLASLPNQGTATKISLTDAGNNKDFWNLYDAEVAGNLPTFDRDISKNGSVKSFISPFDVTYDKDAFTAYSFNPSNVSYTKSTARIIMKETIDNPLKANHPYMLVPKNPNDGYQVIAANSKIAISEFPTKRTGWTLTGTFRKLSNAEAAKYGAVVLSNGKLYAIESGTDSYVPALRSFIESAPGFEVKPTTAGVKSFILSFQSLDAEGTTSVENLSFADKKPLPIYSINGVYLGTDFDALPKGIYIVNNHKIAK